MNKKSGISLVALIVTIIVILIISSTVIINISGSDNQISATQRANIVNDISVFKDELNFQLSSNPRIDLNEFNITVEDTLIKYIPSIYGVKTPSGIEYTKILEIQKGKLVLKSDKDLSVQLEEEEKEAIKELIEQLN